MNVKKRGRPPKKDVPYGNTKEAILQQGLATFTKQGFYTVGIDAILKEVGVPKGSFYHYFKSKEDFAMQVIDRYDEYLCGKLFKAYNNRQLTPLQRISAYSDDAINSMAKHDYQRGCLIGNFAQEVTLLPESIVQALDNCFQNWQQLTCQCLELAKEEGQLNDNADCQMWAEFFWTGWEGAVMRSRLMKSATPMKHFTQAFIQSICA